MSRIGLDGPTGFTEDGGINVEVSLKLGQLVGEEEYCGGGNSPLSPKAISGETIGDVGGAIQCLYWDIGYGAT
jgi:hypothetical protein